MKTTASTQSKASSSLFARIPDVFFRCPVWRGSQRLCWIFLLLLFPLARLAYGTTPPSPGDPPDPDWLDFWIFEDTNTWVTARSHAPLSFTNLNVSDLGSGNALLLDSTNAAWLKYRVYETNGTNLTVDRGSIVFWFAANWTGTNQGGTGPGQWGRLIEVGSYTTNASYRWWSLYFDPTGENLYFASQTNGGGQTHLSAPLAWDRTNRWHLIALTYSPTNSALYLDGQLATNGLAVTYLPSTNVLTNGFFIGSDNTGVAQARGMFDDLSTYDFELSATQVNAIFATEVFFYYLNPNNPANFSSAPSSPTYDPFVAITGAGYLQWVSTNSVNCITSSNVWATNMSATVVGSSPTNQSISFTFEMEGGSNNVPYDVFVSGTLVGSSITNGQWVWVGQGQHCNSYTITNLPTRAFVVLGTPVDSDLDGLTDAYERLVSKTNPQNSDSDGDGIIDGWEVLQGMNPLVDESAQSSGRLNYTYDPTGWLTAVSGKRGESIGMDSEGNILQANP